ncbi:MAG: NAD(P)-dependent dehydrogenase (short-subunit alcohol dehydrogenase family) [Candidatus Azotimanducaceae bacterium]|jgi:NAD(P)-dependent dehydrogenase (short-subunit alcohol dehydrogenase family)|tara:strand:- start:1706 stop:2419 length:714 start_codon:yes stop_codon:yes gene_type:complete
MNVLIVGATGAIGAALLERYLLNPEVEQIIAIHHLPVSAVHDKVRWLTCNLRDDQSIAQCTEQLAALELPIHRWICASGYLQGPLGGPEKSMRNIRGAKLHDDFAVNTIGPILLFSAMANKLKVVPGFKAAFLSAQVGSIEDNQLGGWFGYRMAKAALNMGIRCLAIEAGRWRNTPTIVAIHPGTTVSNLSKAFVKQRKAPLQSAQQCAAKLDLLIEKLTPEETGQFYRLDGSQLPW